jgi:hypothetical protein
MNEWFEVKASYVKQLEDGGLKRVSEPYLVNAISFTDAENRIYEEVGSHVKGEFLIKSIAKRDFADIFHYEDSDDWFKLSISTVTVDADFGKEKKQKIHFLLTAQNAKEAIDRLKDSLSDMIVTYEIVGCVTSKIVEVIPYTPE